MSRRAAPTIRVTKVPQGSQWQVKRDGAERASAIEPTQTKADARAREIARNAGGAEVVTHRPDGRIRSKDSVGGAPDPNPPRDREH
jgi:hypothetical protein